MDFLVSCHYNSRYFETCYYYSSIVKHAITTFTYAEICHWLRTTSAWARLQAYVAYEAPYPVRIPSLSKRAGYIVVYSSLSLELSLSLCVNKNPRRRCGGRDFSGGGGSSGCDFGGLATEADKLPTAAEAAQQSKEVADAAQQSKEVAEAGQGSPST
jgi:hypothetical protein